MKLILMAVTAAFALPAAFVLPAEAQTLSNADREKFAENIVQADANSDGMLSRGEFETLIRLNAEDELGRAAMIQRAGQTTRVFNRIDADADGTLTQQEVQAMAEGARG